MEVVDCNVGASGDEDINRSLAMWKGMIGAVCVATMLTMAGPSGAQDKTLHLCFRDNEIGRATVETFNAGLAKVKVDGNCRQPLFHRIPEIVAGGMRIWLRVR